LCPGFRGLVFGPVVGFCEYGLDFQIPKRKCNWRDFRLSLDVFDLIGFYSALVVRITGVSGPIGCPEIVVYFQSTLSTEKPED